MGYFTTNNIAKESKTPAIVSLSSNPNFIQFESLNNPAQNKHVDISLQILDSDLEVEKTKITIIESESNIRHEYIGTRNRAEVNSTTFLLSEDKAVIAENIRGCLMSDIFFRGNFSVTIPAINNNGVIANGDTIKITSIGVGLHYAFFFETLDADFIKLTGDPTNTNNNDSIDGGEGDTEIEIDMYESNSLFLGVDDTPQNNTPLGVYLTSLTKSYNNVPIWFDLNSLIGSRKAISNEFLNKNGWSNTGTITGFRFTAKRFDSASREMFYISNALYALTGYERNLEQNNLSEYIYNTSENNIVKPLTTQPTLTHISGQSQYFNFILSDPDRNKNLGSGEYNIGILYRLYTQSKRFIAEVQASNQNRKLFNLVNSLKLDIEGAIGAYSNIGIVEVYLSRSDSPVSEPMTFNILPECLYKINDFAFLNSLGGWSSFNFSGTDTTDFKTSTNTIFKTQTPNHTVSSEIESIYNKEVTEQFTAQTMPLKESVCNWLKELSSSIAVYELSTKRYIIVDDLNIKPNSKDELFRLEMKYHYSDSYNALIK